MWSGDHRRWLSDSLPMGSDIPRILIADRHAWIRRTLRTAIPAPAACDEAVNVGDTLEKAVAFAPDVLLLDTALAGPSGLDLTRALRRLLPDAKILILSMYESDDLARQFRDAGAHGYLVKIDAGLVLADAIAAVRSGRPYFQPRMRAVAADADAGIPAAPPPPPARRRLTRRETEVLRLLAEGKSNKEVGAALNISVNTVETHRARILNKLGLHSMNELVRYALRNRLIVP
ncbi:MAG TPA: response regulator transcription factor [Vicinamibacterales bacterium]|nr:response regulator transcription factor [Vicinamibacterales bacterium]